VLTPSDLPGLKTVVVTDDRGIFRLTGLGRDRLAWLNVRGPTIQSSTLMAMTHDAVVIIPPAPEGSEVTYPAKLSVELPQGRTISGIVRDEQTHEPIPGMWVGLLDEVEREGLIRGRFVSDEKGRFSVTGLPVNSPRRRLRAYPPPGHSYFMGGYMPGDLPDVVIDCPRGIPYHLDLRDEAGALVEAEVSYYPVYPNPDFSRAYGQGLVDLPLGRAAKRHDGAYHGAVLPGPGVLVAETPRNAGYRRAHVDPKASFAPWKTNWTDAELRNLYGNDDYVWTGRSADYFAMAKTLEFRSSQIGFRGMRLRNYWLEQRDFAAMLLVDPPDNSAPLELSATLVRDRPRQLTLVDPEGNPVVGARAQALNQSPWVPSAPLRAATFPLTGLHRERGQRFVFTQESRKLIGFLVARGNGVAPYTVRLEPWAAITGRLLDEQGRPLDARTMRTLPAREFAIRNDPTRAAVPWDGITITRDGEFRIDQLIPGILYAADVYLYANLTGVAFEDLKLKPGEVRDLEDIRVKAVP
jgi:hypothetical protein